MEVLVTVTGRDRATRGLKHFQRTVGAPEKAFAEIMVLIAKENERNFGKGTALAQATIDEKAKRGLPAEPLVASGRLRRSVTGVSKSVGAVRTITPYEMRYGTEVLNERGQPYPRWLQYGTKRGLVPRKVLRLTPTTHRGIIELLRVKLLGEP